jgi:predicted ester cyclase
MMNLFWALSPAIQFDAVDIVEDGDRVAVRWRLPATRNGEPLHSAIMAMYRFEGGRIAEDWGISFTGVALTGQASVCSDSLRVC